MKTRILIVTLIFALSGLMAQVQHGETGLFSGKLGTYSSGDTLYCVYATENTGTYPYYYRNLEFMASYDGGEHWQSTTIAQISGLGSPCLSVSDSELIVAYTSVYERFQAISTNGGINWEIQPIGRTFESSPYVEKVDGEYRSFSLELPYPQSEQDRFLVVEGSEKLIMPNFMTDLDRDRYGMTFRFLGPDVLYGVVRSNNDIWIRQAGGGTNNSWPTFYGPVIIGDCIRVYPDGGANFPEAEIFRGGLIEYAPALEPPLPNREIAQLIGPYVHDPNYIIMIEVNGDNYTALQGTITELPEYGNWVYNTYPAEPLGPYIYTNYYTVRDTVWHVLGTGNCANRTFFSPNTMWIKGSFSGHQAWMSSSDIYIIGEITITGTPAGQSPADNPNNSVTLCSEKNIIIKYGYKHPITNERIHLARADSDPLYIYATLAANAPLNQNFDGQITYEYRAPHPSVPDSYWNGELWEKIDLHRYRFPAPVSYPWPPNIDYPWYNPLWPEARPYLERGKIQLWGSMIQRRRGFLHNSYVNIEYLNPQEQWNLAIEYYGGSCSPAVTYHLDPVLGLELGTQNYPGASGPGIGYKNEIYNDSNNSFSKEYPQNYNEPLLWNLGILIGNLSQDSSGDYEEIPIHRLMQLERVRTKAHARRGNSALYAFNNRLLYLNGENVVEVGAPQWEGGDIVAIAWLDEDQALLYRRDPSSSGAQEYLQVLNPASLDAVNIERPGLDEPGFANTPFCDIAVKPNGKAYFAAFDPNQGVLKIWGLDANFQFNPLETWEITIDETQPPAVNSKLVLQAASNDLLDAFVWWGDEPLEGYNVSEGRLYHQRLELPSGADDPHIPAVQKPTLTLWPNPGRTQVSLFLKGMKNPDFSAGVYNIRGQKVRTLSGFQLDQDGILSLKWDGRDQNNRRIPAGVYLIRIKTGNQVIVKKMSWM